MNTKSWLTCCVMAVLAGCATEVSSGPATDPDLGAKTDVVAQQQVACWFSEARFVAKVIPTEIVVGESAPLDAAPHQVVVFYNDASKTELYGLDLILAGRRLQIVRPTASVYGLGIDTDEDGESDSVLKCEVPGLMSVPPTLSDVACYASAPDDENSPIVDGFRRPYYPRVVVTEGVSVEDSEQAPELPWAHGGRHRFAAELVTGSGALLSMWLNDANAYGYPVGKGTTFNLLQADRDGFFVKLDCRTGDLDLSELPAEPDSQGDEGSPSAPPPEPPPPPASDESE